MSTESNPKKRPHNAENEDDPIIFKILEGAMEASDYSSFCLLVPEHSATRLLNALRNAYSAHFVWSIGDEEITDIQNIPAKLAYPIRSIDKIPNDKSESELLDWLIHGESFFSKKYVILRFEDRNEPYEVREKQHLKKFTDALDKIVRFSCADGDMTSLSGYYVIDRGQYLRKFDYCKVADDNVVKIFEQMAAVNDPLLHARLQTLILLTGSWTSG